MVCIGGHFYFVEIMKTNQFKNCSINLNAQHTNGMTPLSFWAYIVENQYDY